MTRNKTPCECSAETFRASRCLVLPRGERADELEFDVARFQTPPIWPRRLEVQRPIDIHDHRIGFWTMSNW